MPPPVLPRRSMMRRSDASSATAQLMSRATSIPSTPGNMLTRMSPVPSSNFVAVTTWSGTTIGRFFSLEFGTSTVGSVVEPFGRRTVNVYALPS
jgi:hypothetical protein